MPEGTHYKGATSAAGKPERAGEAVDAGYPAAENGEQFHVPAGMLAQVTDAVVLIDSEHRIRYWNEAAAWRYGVSEADALGRPVTDIYTWRFDNAEDEAAAREDLAARGCWQGENLHIARDGRTWRVESTVAVVRNGNGQPYGLVAVIRDISAPAGDKTRRARARSQASEQLSRQIFGNAVTPIAISDRQGRLEECNDAYCALVGYSREELMANNFAELIHPEDRAENLAVVKRVLSGEIPSTEIENRYVRKNGEFVWVHKFISVAEQENGVPTRLMAMATDVTARRRAESDANFLLRLDHVIASAANGADLADGAVRLLGKYLDVDRCSFSEFDPRRDVITVAHQWRAAGGVSLAQYELRRLYDPEVVRALKAGETIGIADLQLDPRSAGFGSGFAALGFRSLAQTAYLHDGEPVALIAAIDSNPRRWNQADLALLREVISRVWPAVERARVTEELRQSEERLRLAAQAAGFGIRDYDAMSDEGFWSDELYDILGLPRGSESNPESLLAVVHPEDRARVAEGVSAALDPEGSGELDMEFRIVRASDGAMRWVQHRSRTFFSAGGGAKKAVRKTGILLDITARKEAEAALAAAVERLDAHIENSPLAIIHFDAESRITRWSREAERLFGWTPAEMLGNSIEQLHWVDEDDLRIVRALCRGDRDGLPLAVANVSRNYRKDGSIAECEWHCSATRDEEGSVRYLLCQVLDITDRRVTEKRLLEAQKMESVAVLAGGIAHDFNNLLMGVIGNASIAREMLPPENPVQQLLECVIKAGEQTSGLTRQMLAYAGKGQFVIEPIDLSASIREVSDLMRATTPREIAIRLEIEPDLPPIRADRSQIRQVLMNLVTNAAEAIGRAAGVVLIRCGVDTVAENLGAARFDVGEISPGRYVRLEVRDTGTGMDEATRGRIFDPFFTTKFQGRGLGLAAVAGIVRAHGGAIRVSSIRGRGASMTLLFPVAKSEAERPVPKVRPEEIRSRADFPILVIDDDEPILGMMSAALTHHGYRVLTAKSAFEGIGLLGRHASEINVIILDLSMPGMSGQEALPRLLAIKPQVDILVSSGYTDADALDLLAGAPVSGFLQKPYTMDVLAARVEAILKARSNRGI